AARAPSASSSTLFPYTTLFRSALAGHRRSQERARGRRGSRAAAGRTERGDGGGAALRDARRPYGRDGRHLRRDGLGQGGGGAPRSEEHTSELQSRENLVCRLLR